MLDGHIEQLADPDTVYEHPASAFVAGFIGQNNFLAGVLAEAGRLVADGRHRGRASGCRGCHARPPWPRRRAARGHHDQRPGMSARAEPACRRAGRRLPPRRCDPVRRHRRRRASSSCACPRAPCTPPRSRAAACGARGRPSSFSSSRTTRPSSCWRPTRSTSSSRQAREHPQVGEPMARNDDTTRILIPRHTAERIAQSLSRRRFLGLAGAPRLAQHSWPRAAAAAAGAAAAASGSGGRGSGGDAAAAAAAAAEAVAAFNLYTWAEYDDPDLMSSFGQHHDRHLQLERGGHPEARRLQGFLRLRHGRPDRRRTSPRWCRRVCSKRSTWPSSRTSRTSTRSTRTRPSTPGTSTACRRTGARPAGSTTTPSSRPPSRPGRTSSMRR